MVEGAEKVEILNAFFVSGFNAKASSQESLTQETRKRVWRKGTFPWIVEVWVRAHSDKPDIHESMGPDGMQPQVLRELVDIIASPDRKSVV